MKKTVTINLGGLIYHIDDDGYAMLQKYLDEIKNELIDIDGLDEILHDIEMRISEIFSERMKTNRQVVVLTDVEHVIATMGQPGDISGKADAQRTSYRKQKYKKMYRDTDNPIIAGVCGGIAAYWGMDPVIVRIVFVVLTIFAFSGLIIYLVLWIVLPEANTVSQKLEMRGEPVDLSNIRDYFKDEFNNVKRSFQKK